jgi:membrane-associated phospholipid phosphatase
MFHSYTTIVFSCVGLIALFAFITLRRSPFYIISQFWDQLLTKRFIFLHLLATSLILVINKLELYAENRFSITEANFTRDIYQFEGSLTGLLQNVLQNDTLTYVLTVFYVIVFPAVIIASLLIYVCQKNELMTRAFFYAIMMNYAIALPFYLFFPVDEVWVYHKQVDFLIPQFYPNFEMEYRPLSGINNCIPSLHTSISVSMALLAIYSGIQAWKWITGISALLIVFATNYLGIHWFFDIVSGLVLAIASCSAAILISRGSTEIYVYPLMERNTKE